MRTFEFAMALSAQKTQSIYQGQARSILVETDKGLKLQLPVANFRSHVNVGGIHGRFRIKIDADNKIVALLKL